MESISRTTKRMEVEGLIGIISAKHFRIPDLGRLVKMGCLDEIFDKMRLPTPVRRSDRSAGEPFRLGLAADRADAMTAVAGPQLTAANMASRPRLDIA